MSGESRPTGKGIMDAANLAFLFLVLSDVYLWWPKPLRWGQPPAPAAPAGGARGEGAGRGGGARVEGAPAANTQTERVEEPLALNVMFRTVEDQNPGWQSLSLRLPMGAAPATMTVDYGDGGQPHLRGTVTLNAATGAIESAAPFTSLTPGRRLRNVLRFSHTGEVLGIPGQTIAGLVSAGGAMLVYTGIALALRRFIAWRKKPSAASKSVAA